MHARLFPIPISEVQTFLPCIVPSMAPEQLPVVDLRFISQTELQTLFHSCPHSYDPLRFLSDESTAVPKIDRSVFNESAGSRKQTYSRLHLAPHSTSKRHHPHANPNDPSSSSFNQIDSSSREHHQIISNLRRLFAREDPSFLLPVPPPPPPPPPVAGSPRPQTLTLGAPPNSKDKEEEDTSKALVVLPNNDRDKEILTAKGVAVSLAELAAKQDPYSEELRKRTAGLKSEPELLTFLGGLQGDWMSRRQRRRFVDASAFGDHLPKGWKLLLGLKRKEGVPWVNCRRYVSPNGHHFETCKEVSSYIQSLLGISIAVATVSSNSNGISLGENKASTLSFAVASHPAGNENGPQQCTKCNLSFGDKGKYLQHQLSFHQKSRKRPHNNNPLEDGALTKDGKHTCQFCNKTFDEKTRYISHIEAHIRYQGLDTDEKDSGTTPVATGGPSMVEDLKNEKKPKIETDCVVNNPKNEQTVLIEAPASTEISTKEAIHVIQAHPSTESSKIDTGFAIQTSPSIENPVTDKIDGIQDSPSIKEPKIDKAALQSPSVIKISEDSKAPASLPPFIENTNDNKSVSMPGPTSIINPENIQTTIAKAPPIENSENENKSEISEIHLIENPANDRKHEATEIQVSFSSENPKNNSEPITEDGNVEMPESKPLEGDKGYGLTGSQVEKAVCGPLDNSSGASASLYGQIYQDGSATDGTTPLMFDPSNLSQSCSPVTPDKDSEVENNVENEHGTDNLVMNHEVVNSKTKEVESSEVRHHAEAEPENDIFESTFTSTCSLEASQQACPDIETFDLNNYDIVDDGSKPEDIISATHRMLFESDTGALSDETSFMDCDSVGEPKEVELAERPFTFSELLANANAAHANATLAETNQACQESESLDLNNNTSDRIDNNEVEYEVNKLATSNTIPSQNILTTTSTMDYNTDLFASCFSANMNEPSGVGGFDINSRDSLLEEWEKPSTGLENRFQNSSSGCEDIVGGGTGHNFMEMMTIQENLEGYTSLMQSASTIPVANMMQDKLNNVGYQYQSQNNVSVPSFSGMRLAPPEPSVYVPMPSANNPLHFPMPQQNMMFGYVPPQMVSNMGLQLDWGLTTPPTKMMMPPVPCQFTSVCVWCNREFRHDGSMAEQQQSDSVGLICPSCKDRFPGHGHLGL